MTLTVNNATLAFELGFGSGPLVESPTWTDVSDYVHELGSYRGRGGPLQRFDAGTCTWLLQNDDGRFDPGNTSSPYDPDVKLRVPARVRATYNSITYTIFRGMVERWPLTYGDTGRTSWVTLPMVDLTSLLAQRKFVGRAFAAHSTGTRIGLILDACGWPAGLRDIDTGVASCPGESLTGSALELIYRAVDAEAGFFFIAADGSATFRDRVHHAGGAVSAATFGDGVGDLPFSDPQFAYDDDTLITQVIATRDGGVPQEASDGTEYDLIGLDVTGSFLDDNSALNVAEWLVARHKDVRRRVTGLTFEPQFDQANLWPQAFGLELRDAITVQFTPPGGGTAVDQVCAIESISHSMARAGAWQTRLGVHPLADVETYDYWILGTSALGTDTRLA